MPNNDYRAASGVNWSTLKHILNSPRQYLYALNNPVQPTPAMQFGTAVHCAVLEPDVFAEKLVEVPDEYVTATGALSTSKAAKEWRAQQDDDAILLTAQQLCAVAEMRVNLGLHRDATEALKLADVREQGLFWTDAASGIDCKACPDAFSGMRVLDVKTWSPRGKFSADAFMREAVNRGYLGQLGFYAMGILAATGHKVEAMQFLVLQATAPYDVMLLELDIDAMRYAEQEAGDALEALANWIAEGRPDEGAEPQLVLCNLPWKRAETIEDGSDLEGL